MGVELPVALENCLYSLKIAKDSMEVRITPKIAKNPR
jgi:hypothetical protein